MEVLDKHFEVVFYSLNKTRFDEYLALKEKAREANNAPLLELIPAMLEELDTFANKETEVKKDFYAYYSQFSPLKNLKSSQKNKIKLAQDYLNIILRKQKANERIPVSLKDFWQFFLHRQASEFFTDHWFLLENKYTFFSKDFFAHLLRVHSFLYNAIETLDPIPPVFLPLSDDHDRSDDRTFHLIEPLRTEEMSKQFDLTVLPEKLQLQGQHWQRLLEKSNDGSAYLLLLY